MSLQSQAKQKKIIADPTDVPENNPYVDEAYIGDPEFLLRQVKKRFETYKLGLTLRQPFIYESIAFFAGQQSMWWNPGSSRMEPIPIPDPTRSTAINNRILNKCRAVIQRLVAFDPTAQCVPAGPSQMDIYSARMAKKLVESNHHDPKLNYRGEYEKFAEFVVIQGMGWLRTEWDPFGGRCSVTYKEQPVWQDIQVEANQEGESAYDELGEYMNNPMEEIDENQQKTKTQSGKTGDGSASDGGQNSDESKNEPGASGNGDEGGTQANEQITTEPDSGQVWSPIGEGGVDSGPAIPKYKTIRVPKLDPTTFKQVHEPILDENGKPMVEKIEFDGCVVKKAVGPLNIYYNPTISDWSDAFDVFEEEYLTIDEVKTKYPSCSDLSENDYEKNDANPWVTLFQNNIAKNSLGQNSGISVKTFFCKSCPDFPRGLKLVIIKDKIRVGIPMPTLNGDCLPYDFAGYIHFPGGFWYLSLPMYLKNPQLILNKLLRQYLDHANQFAVPKILKKNETRFTNTITNGVEIISYEGDAPIFQNPQSTSGAHMEMIKYMDDTLDTNSGVNKTAEGNPPPNVTSGDMAEAITENDYQLHMLDIDRVALAITGTCNKEVRYMKDKAAKDVLARYVGPGGKWMVSKFKMSNMRNISDVIFIPGKAANLSRGQQRKDLMMILPIVTQGQGDPAQQKIIIDKLLEYITYGEEEAMISSLNKQQSNILDILDELESNALNPSYDATKMIMPWDDMAVWVDAIETQLLDYTDFNQKPAVTKQRLIKLWEACKNRLALNMGMKQAGGPPGGGQAPQPAPPPSAPPQAAPLPAPNNVSVTNNNQVGSPNG